MPRLSSWLAVFFGFLRYQNRPPQLVGPNYMDYYLTQDTKPEGRVGILISHLIMPEEFRGEDYAFLALKSTQYMPWPIRDMVRVDDKGTVLLDPVKFYEFEKFTPTQLVDYRGDTIAFDGEAYIDKYNRGEIEWVPPRPTRHLDYGYFLLPTQKAGMPTLSNKLVSKAKNYYHAPGKGFADGRVPHEAGNWAIASEGMRRIEAKYGSIPWKWVTADNPELQKDALFELLDEGIDTLILAPPRPVYSHHEEFNGSFKHAIHYLHEWQEARNNHDKIKVIFGPQLADFPVIYDAYEAMLRDRLDTLPKTASVKVVVSVHGMAWDKVPHEGWIKLSPPYVEGNMKRMGDVLASYGFPRSEIVQAQDHFADPINNPTGKYLSTNVAFWDGIKDDYDYIVNVPIEFFAENTDTMFSHAMYNFENFDEFDIYEPVDYKDWSLPFTRSYVQNNTTVIYNGVPVGKYNEPIIQAYVQALDSILSQSLTPLPHSEPAVEPEMDEVGQLDLDLTNVLESRNRGSGTGHGRGYESPVTSALGHGKRGSSELLFLLRQRTETS